MPVIFVEGLGEVEIAGEVPTAQEQAAIAGALTRSGETAIPRPQLGPDLQGAVDRGDPSSGLEGLTGGFVNRGAAQALGATGATALAAPTSPAGMVLAPALGAGAGGQIFDFADAVTRSIRSEPPRDISPEAQFKAAFEDISGEGAATAAAGAAGPLLKGTTRGIGKVLGLDKDSARIADIAAREGISIGPIQASKSKALKSVSRVLGVFPFVNKPFKNAEEAAQVAVDARFHEIMNELAPTATTISRLGENLVASAGNRIGKVRRVAGSLYNDFFAKAEALSTPDVFPSSVLNEAGVPAGIRDVAEGLVNRARQNKTILRSGKELSRPVTDPLQTYVDDLTDLPDHLTAGQLREMQRDLTEAIGKASADGFDVSRGRELKVAIEKSLNSADLSRVSAAEGEAVSKALRNANTFFHEAMKPFETATAGRFGRVDRRIFGPGVFKAGSVNPDEALKAVLNTKSPRALSDLRKIAGPRVYQETVRTHLEEIYRATTKLSPSKGDRFDPAAFRAALGGDESMAELLKGSGVSPSDMNAFLSAAETAVDFVAPDVALFLQRRFTLTGLKGVMGGLFLTAGGGANPLSTAAAILMTRKAGRILTDPDSLRAMTRVLDDTVPDQQKRALLLRVGRAVLDDDEPQNRRLRPPK